MDNNKLDYESTSEDNTSIEENERFVKLTKRASSKYINSNPKPKPKIQTTKPIISYASNQTTNNQINNNQTTNNQSTNNQAQKISNDIRKIVKVSNSTLLLIKGRR
jgi:hypothetical protein